MSIYDLIRSDHSKLNGLFDQLEQTSTHDEKKREKLFNELAEELTLHMRAEEDVLYFRLRDADVTQDLIGESCQEHHVVDVLLEELEDLPFTDEKWGPKLTLLRKNMEHHIQEEEDELFSKAGKTMSDEEALLLAQELERAKERHRRPSQAA